MTTQIEADQKGERLKRRIVEAIIDARNNSERTQQAKQRRLGMSDLGGCREFIRATIAGEPKGREAKIKWPAEVGTAVGDHVEKILSTRGFDVQETVILTLPLTGIEVTGHLDEVDVEEDAILDNKTVDGTDTVEREGPSFKNKVQISGYLVAAVQARRVTEEGTGHLIYFDRSGKQSEPFVWSVTYANALLILAAAEERLLDVQHALATGSREGRDGKLMTDEPPSWCKAVQCPFYDACWAGSEPTGKVDHPRQLDAVRRLIEARAEQVSATSRREAAKEDLRGVEGLVTEGPHKGTIVRWKLSESPTGRITDRLEVVEPK